MALGINLSLEGTAWRNPCPLPSASLPGAPLPSWYRCCCCCSRKMPFVLFLLLRYCSFHFLVHNRHRPIYIIYIKYIIRNLFKRKKKEFLSSGIWKGEHAWYFKRMSFCDEREFERDRQEGMWGFYVQQLLDNCAVLISLLFLYFTYKKKKQVIIFPGRGKKVNSNCWERKWGGRGGGVGKGNFYLRRHISDEWGNSSSTAQTTHTQDLFKNMEKRTMAIKDLNFYFILFFLLTKNIYIKNNKAHFHQRIEYNFFLWHNLSNLRESLRFSKSNKLNQ